MNLPDFTLKKVASLEQAVAALHDLEPDAKVLAGGTDILVKMKHRRLTPRHLVDIKGIAGLDYIAYEPGEGLRIGALATIEALKRSLIVKKHFPILQQAAALMATVVIRNRATVVGNICNGSPSAELGPGLIAAESSVRIVGPAGERSVPVEDFFTGPSRTVLRPDELVQELLIPEPAPETQALYEKWSLRRMDVAVVSVAALVVPRGDTIDEVGIVLGAVAPTPLRARAAEETLRGQAPSGALIAEAARLARSEAKPISDIRGTAGARSATVESLTAQVLTKIVKAAKLGGG